MKHLRHGKEKAAKKAAPKKKAAKKKIKKVIDEPLKTVIYKQGDLIDGYKILEEAAARTKRRPDAVRSLNGRPQKVTITLHILGGVALTKSKK
jgi:hypothetical protein